MKNPALFGLFALMVTSLGFGQGRDLPFSYYNPMNWQSFASKSNMAIVYKGTPYLEDEYKTGTASIHGKTDFTAPMRYNAYENKIEFLDQDQVQRELLRRPYITANIGGTTYSVQTYLEEGKEKFGYFSTRNNGEATLLYRPKKILIKEYSTNADKILKYKDDAAFYIKTGNGHAILVDMNQKSILGALDHTEELEAYVSGFKLNLRNEADVIRVLDFYNTLIKNIKETKAQA